MRLQNHLAGLVHQPADNTSKPVTLRDICFKPLEPDNDNCTIQSVFNYFQVS